MHKSVLFALVLACTAGSAAAQSRATPTSVNVRFSEQISNGPAGSCGCFAMEGAAGDITWTLRQYGVEHAKLVGAVADLSIEHTGKVTNAPYGLTLTTLAFGPRFVAPAFKSNIFAQILFGFTHGSGSQFPEHGSLVSSANSFALDLGAGVDYPLNKRVAIRIAQVEYLRTSLPNNSSNWQNNFRFAAGITIRLSR